MAKKTSKSKTPMMEKSMRDCPQMMKQGPGSEMGGKKGKMKKKRMRNDGY